jgi:hypothetical protein
LAIKALLRLVNLPSSDSGPFSHHFLAASPNFFAYALLLFQSPISNSDIPSSLFMAAPGQINFAPAQLICPA